MRKRIVSPLILILSLIFMVSCTRPMVKGIESSINEVGDISNVKVTADGAKITNACSKDSTVLKNVDKNNVLNVVEQVEDWYAVKMPDNSIGFIPSDQCKPVVVEDGDGTAPEGNNVTAKAPTKAPTKMPGNTGGGDGAPVTPKPEKDANSNSLTNQEQEMFNLVNQARSQNNVPALAIDMELTKVARIKSQDMIDNNYFSHNSPTYGSPFDMMKSFGIKYVKAGENIAGNQNVASAHDALMNSPGHRQNILSPDYTHIGIGIKKGGQYGNMFTQMFISKPK